MQFIGEHEFCIGKCSTTPHDVVFYCEFGAASHVDRNVSCPSSGEPANAWCTTLI